MRIVHLHTGCMGPASNPDLQVNPVTSPKYLPIAVSSVKGAVGGLMGHSIPKK